MRLEELFLNLLNMSITAGYVVIAVILLRLLLRKAPRWISCALWALVGLRLILPFSFESVMSLIPSAATVTPDILYSASPAISSGVSAVNSIINPAIVESLSPVAAASANPMQIVMSIAGIVWLAGMLAMALYSAVTYIRLRRKVDSAVLLRDNIYESDAISSPFVLGIVGPRIYLPFAVGEEHRGYVVSHEQAHILRKDHWIKPLGFLLLTVYWFNPLIWVAYVLLCRDIEVACDEAVIRDIGGDEKRAYSLALLGCAVRRRNIAMCPLAFGEVGIKERVKNVLNYKKPAFWIIIVAVVVCIVAGICLLSNPKEKADTSYEHPNAEQLFACRTDYVGDNSAVGDIVSLLEFPTDVEYDNIELQTSAEPYGVYVYFSVTPEVKAAYNASASENIDLFRENACIMFSLIGNVDEVTFRLDDGTESPVDLQFTREWAESVVGADLWEESGNAEKLDGLITRINEHLESAYASADEGMPTGTFTPAGMAYLCPSFSVTADGFLESNADRNFEIKSNSLRDSDNEYSVQYAIMDVGDSIQTLGDSGDLAFDVSGYTNKAGWRVLKIDGSDTGYRIFRMNNEIWIGHWVLSDNDAGLCEYIFRLKTEPSGREEADSDGIQVNFLAGQYYCGVTLPGDWEGLYTVSQRDYGITFYDEANSDSGGCLFAVYWMTDEEADDPWSHGIAIDGCKLIHQTDGGGFYAVYPYTDVEYDYEDEKKATEYQSMLADMDSICHTFVYSMSEENALDKVVSSAFLEKKKEGYHDGECTGEGHIILGSETISGVTKVYALTMHGEYGFEDGNFVKVSGTGIIPAVFTFTDSSDGLVCTKIEYPKDGSEYAKSLKEMFPYKYQERALDPSDSDMQDLQSQERAYAAIYLKGIGRDAVIGDYGDFEHTLLTDVGVSVDVSNSITVNPLFSNYPMWIGNREMLENGVRYVYQKSYDKTAHEIVFTKYEYDTNKIVKRTRINSITGEIIETSDSPDELK